MKTIDILLSPLKSSININSWYLCYSALQHLFWFASRFLFHNLCESDVKVSSNKWGIMYLTITFSLWIEAPVIGKYIYNILSSWCMKHFIIIQCSFLSLDILFDNFVPAISTVTDICDYHLHDKYFLIHFFHSACFFIFKVNHFKNTQSRFTFQFSVQSRLFVGLFVY